MSVWLAIVISTGCICWLSGHFLFQGDFTIVERMRECEQPSNNRCRDVYLVRDAGGGEHVETLAGFRGPTVVGSHIQKNKFAMVYRVDGRPDGLGIDAPWVPASLIALSCLANAFWWAHRTGQR